MCYNKEISLAVYLTTSAVSLILYLIGDKYDKHIALFSIVFIHMQLVEYFMWSDQSCGKINHYATEAGYYLLFLHKPNLLVTVVMLDVDEWRCSANSDIELFF